MTVIAWHSWFVVTDENGDDKIVHFSSHNGDTWEDLPDDGCLGVRLIHAAEFAPGKHYAVSLIGTWYYRAESNLGVTWNAVEDYERDLKPGRYRNLCVKQGKTIPYEVWSPLVEEMSRTVV